MVGTCVRLRFVISCQPSYKYYPSIVVVSAGFLLAIFEARFIWMFIRFPVSNLLWTAILPVLEFRVIPSESAETHFTPDLSLNILVLTYLDPPFYSSASRLVFSTSSGLRNIINVYFLIMHILIMPQRSSQDEDQLVLGWTWSLRSTSQSKESKQTNQLYQSEDNTDL